MGLFTADLVAGVDEVGRGPLAGPVVAAAVVLDPTRPIAGLKDSKKLSAQRRRDLDADVRRRALAVAVGRADVGEIDEINVLNATMLAMRRAVARLNLQPELVFVDGNKAPELRMPVVAVVAGDDRVPAISAASIVAKVVRDAEMEALARIYPQYGFERHKGYATRAHLTALQRFGPTPLHRSSFAPVREVKARTTYLEARP
jgi:ribonuclease HII